MMSDETTTEQLAEIEGQAEDTPATEYTPPVGWRVLAVGEVLQPGDQVVQLHDGKRFPTERAGQYVCETQRYIRPIEPQPQPKPEPQPVQVREGRWRTRHGDICNVTPTPAHDSRATRWPWRDAKYDQTWREDGGCYIFEESPLDLVEYLGPIEPDKTQELPEYTPPEGWRVVRFGEQLLPGDVWVNHDGTEQRSNILQWDAASVSGGRCIRRIKPQPEPQTEPQAEPVQVREGRWLKRSGVEVSVSAMPRDHEDFTAAFPWWDGQETTWTHSGHLLSSGECPLDLVKYLGPIEPQPEPKPQPEPNAATIEELRREVSHVQRLLGESRQRVTELEELVGSLRNINEAQEKTVEAAGKDNTALRNQLAAVKAELASVAADRYRLQIELDAAQQVPADSPELRQLRADLAEVTRERDQYLDSYQRIFGDLETIRETTKAAVVEAIAEWLQPIRAVDNEHLANETLQHLPQIMRHLTGLDSHAID